MHSQPLTSDRTAHNHTLSISNSSRRLMFMNWHFTCVRSKMNPIPLKSSPFALAHHRKTSQFVSTSTQPTHFQEVKVMDMEQPSGWVIIPLTGPE